MSSVAPLPSPSSLSPIRELPTQLPSLRQQTSSSSSQLYYSPRRKVSSGSFSSFSSNEVDSSVSTSTDPLLSGPTIIRWFKIFTIGCLLFALLLAVITPQNREIVVQFPATHPIQFVFVEGGISAVMATICHFWIENIRVPGKEDSIGKTVRLPKETAKKGHYKLASLPRRVLLLLTEFFTLHVLFQFSGFYNAMYSFTKTTSTFPPSISTAS